MNGPFRVALTILTTVAKNCEQRTFAYAPLPFALSFLGWPLDNFPFNYLFFLGRILIIVEQEQEW